MSDMDKEETRATQKLYNPANIDKMIEKCRNSEILTFYEPSEQEIIEQALEFYKRKDKIMGLVGRFTERRDKLKQIVSIDIEPHYWEKENYALGTLDWILYGKMLDKHIEKSSEREEER